MESKSVLCNMKEEFFPLNDDAIDPPSEKLEPRWINVKGREEHEAMLRDNDKMWSLGLDPAYEKIVYLKRWGTWLNGCHTYDGG